MCGIIGGVSQQNIVPKLLEGLKRLEYRGYDSAGIAVIDDNNKLQRRRAVGKINVLEKLLAEDPIAGCTGISHTRWATHGKANENNAHPHIVGNELALVHNGIIEDHQSLRTRLLAEGCKLTSDTDSELIAHLVYLKIQSGQDFLTAVRNTATELRGAYALAFIRQSEPGRVIAIRSGSPLVVGLGENQNFTASDSTALLAFTRRFIFLEEGDIADIYIDKVTIYNQAGAVVERPVRTVDADQVAAFKGDYKHFMLKEIFEQPGAILSTLQGRLTEDGVIPEAFGDKAPEIFKRVRRVQIVACGTSYHAGLVARYWFEEVARVPCQVEIASEYRYRSMVIEADTLFVTISQSGETADTLAALRFAKNSGYVATLSICNVAESSIVRESDLVLLTDAGIEVGVASTKAFTTQLVALFLLVMAISQKMQPLLADELIELAAKVQQSLDLDAEIAKMARQLVNKTHVLFLGRGIEYPIAMEGALKLKEISYIHAEAYPAGELKHGPLALVDEKMSVIALAPDDELLEKLKSNLEEVLTRGGQLIVFADVNAKIVSKPALQVLIMPRVNRLFAPIVYAIPMQLLAYHVANIKGNDIDQPRNLAKSVTVE